MKLDIDETMKKNMSEKYSITDEEREELSAAIHKRYAEGDQKLHDHFPDHEPTPEELYETLGRQFMESFQNKGE